MAKFEEGDARWIVQDLGDQGQNVNGWHWREYDAMEWAQNKLKALFCDVDLLAGTGSKLLVTEVICKGEAIVNNRKAKLIPAYELDITLKFTGTPASHPDSTVTGRILLPYVADENHDEKPEMRFSSETDDTPSQRLKEAYASKAEAVIVGKINELVSELRAGGPCKPGSKEAAAGKPEASSSAQATAEAKAKLSSANPDEVKPAAAAKSKSSASRKTTLSLKETYYARPSDIFECFVVEGKVKAFTQSNASIEPRVGGKVSWFNGSVGGEFTELEADKKIVMKWRFNTWADDCFSKVTITLESPEVGTTILQLNQTGIPYEDKFGQQVIETAENGWRNLVLNRIRQVFGYGV